MDPQQFSSGDVYTMKKFLKSYVNQQRFYGKKKPPTHEIEDPLYVRYKSLHILKQTQQQLPSGFPVLQGKPTPPSISFHGKHMKQAIRTRMSISLPQVGDGMPTMRKQERMIKNLLVAKNEHILIPKQELDQLIGYSKLNKRHKQLDSFDE